PDVGAGVYRLAFELIDLLVDAPQCFGVHGAEITPAGTLRHVAQQRLVDFHWTILEAESHEAASHRHWCHALRPDPDRVDLHADGRRRLCGRPRLDGATVVLAISQQNHHAGFPWRIAKPVRGGGNG